MHVCDCLYTCFWALALYEWSDTKGEHLNQIMYEVMRSRLSKENKNTSLCRKCSFNLKQCLYWLIITFHYYYTRRHNQWPPAVWQLSSFTHTVLSPFASRACLCRAKLGIHGSCLTQWQSLHFIPSSSILTTHRPSLTPCCAMCSSMETAFAPLALLCSLCWRQMVFVLFLQIM